MKTALLSMIGTGPGKRTEKDSTYEYKKARYIIPGDKGIISKAAGFTFLALGDHIEDIDDVWVFGTPQAMWFTVGDYFNTYYKLGCDSITSSLFESMGTYQTENLNSDLAELSARLNSRLDSKQYYFKTHGYLRTHEEHWEFFYMIRDIVKNYDRVYLDITHGFRHIPLILYSALVYTESIFDKPSIAGIYYAAYEMAKNAHDKDEPRPIVDVTTAWEMARWFHAVRDFRHNGNARDLVELLAQNNKDISEKTQSIHQSLQTTITPKLANKVKNLKKAIDKIIPGGPVPYNDILNILESEFQGILEVNLEWQRQFIIAHWYYRHKMYMQAITLLKEAWVTRFLESTHQEALSVELRKKISQKESPEGKQFREWMNKHRSKDRKQDYWQNYSDISGIRNVFNHGGYMEGDHSNQVKSKIDKMRDIFTRSINRVDS